MRARRRTYLPEALNFRGPAGLTADIEAAAAAERVSPSEWMRRACVEKLRASQILTGPAANDDAGALAPAMKRSA